MRRIGTTTRGYLKLWAMNWADLEHHAGAVCKSPTDILTESVVVMEWKGMSTSIAILAAPSPVDAAIDVRLLRATPSQGRLVKLVLVDLRRA